MSVVNRMLQDIDRRVGGTALDAASPVPDIRSLRPRAPHGRSIRYLAAAAVVVVAMVALFATGWGERLRSASGSSMAQGQPFSEAVTPPPAPREPIESFKLSFDLSPLKAPARPADVAQVAKPNKASGAVRPVAAAAPPPVTVRVVEPAGAAPASPLAVRQVAAGETVASARVMWQEGSRNNAYATLREALAAAEASRDPQATRTLALELARLELAGNRAQAALDLLRRHGVLLADDADALALRGNAQQRLVLHGEAAESYLAALRVRPTEGKWMLGAAISLAADGRTEEAQVWANRARDRGAITPPIAAYLQQLGVGTRP